MPLISSIILHYKRPENVNKWIAGIRNQTIESKIIVWDNSGDYPAGSGEDVLIRSTENFYCIPRILIAGLCKTEYIYNQDDDLEITDKKLFEKFIAHSKAYPDYVIGWNGRIFSKDINWEKAYQSPEKGFVDYQNSADKTSIDMINFGVSFLRTELINQIPINAYTNKLNVTDEELIYGDDIWVSYFLKKKRTIDFNLRNSYNYLNEYEERKAALSKQPPHMDCRNSICVKLFKGKYYGRN